MTYFFAIFMALIAYSCISIGMVLMKKGIRWMGWKGKKNKEFYTNLLLWITGFIIMNIYGVPSAVALKTLPPHLVAACAGWGIVVLVFLSFFMLKERLFKSDYLFSALIITGIFLLNFFEKKQPDISASDIDITGLTIISLIPLLFFGVGFLNRLTAKIQTLIFAAVSGTSAGVMVVSLRLLVVSYGYQIPLYFSSPYLYLYIGTALLSFIALQVACKKGSMMIIGPVQYSGNILYPVAALLAVFHQFINVIQVLAIGIIVYSVIKILKKH